MPKLYVPEMTTEQYRANIDKAEADNLASYEANEPINVACPWCYQGTEVPTHKPDNPVFCDWCGAGLEYIETSTPKDLINDYCGPYKQDLQHPPTPQGGRLTIELGLRDTKPKDANQLELF